ncbi:MAG TPA: helix-turn-helix transcriptional regulator [Blastocatellia bacterium]|nr:helix-turn-helix transcriptional regulator [Blastocatellia bacterium]
MSESLGEFEQLILFALLRLGDNAYGVTIRQEIENRTGRNISSGAVYTALDRMEGRGYVSSIMGEPTPERGGRRKKFYRLEAAGSRALSRSYDALQRMAKGLAPKLGNL